MGINKYLITTKISKIIKILLICGVFPIFFSGCIELEERVTLHQDGSGTLSRTIITTNPMILKVLKKESFSLEGMKVNVRNVIKQKKLYHYQWIDFKSISELSIKGEMLNLSVEKGGLFGFGKKKSTFKHAIAIEEPPESYGEYLETPDEFERYKFMLLGMSNNIFFNYILELPGEIKDVYSLKVGDVEVEPSIKENSITWSIPVTLLLDAVGKPILVKADFAGKMNTTGNVISQHGIKKLLAKNKQNEAMTTYKALVKITGKKHSKILSAIMKAKAKQDTITKPSYLYTRPQIANFRASSSLTSKKMGQLKQNTKVEKLSLKGEWFEIKIGNKIGWLHESVVSELPSEKRDEDELIRPVRSDWNLKSEGRRRKNMVMNEEKGGTKELKKGNDGEGINKRRSFSTRTALTPSTKRAHSTLEAEYTKAVKEIVKENWSFPVVGKTLKASVALKIERDGKAKDIWFEKKSKNRQFNKSILHTLRKTLFPTAPDGILDEVFVITFHSTMPPTKVAFSPSTKTDGFVQYTKGKSKLDVGDYKAAREDFNQILKTFPNSKLALDAKYWLAESYYREGAYKKAIIEFEKMIRDNPTGGKVASALLKQAEAFKKLGDKGSAGFLYQQIIKEFPKTSQASNAKYELNRI